MRSKINLKKWIRFFNDRRVLVLCTLHAPNVVDSSQDQKQSIVLKNVKIEQNDYLFTNSMHYS